MPQKKKQETQQTTEVQLAEDQSTPTTVSSVEDITSQVKPLLNGEAGYVVLCGMCKTEIWVFNYDDDLVYICGPCAELLPK
jgi:hypothetical protein